MAIRQMALLLLLLVAAHGAVATTPVIEAACAAVSHNSTHHTDYDFCVRALSADPAASSAADALGLAKAAVNLTVANITGTRFVISDLVVSLEGCLKYYALMEDTVALALGDLSVALAAEAYKKLLHVMDYDYPGLCTLILGEAYAQKEPIDPENNNIYLVSAMASDITELLLRAHALPPQASM